MTRIARVCHQLERPLLTASADQQRDLWVLLARAALDLNKE